MSWATIEWPPKDGTRLRPRSKSSRIIKCLVITAVGLLILLIAFILLAFVYRNVPWPYPVNVIQTKAIEVTDYFRQKINLVNNETADLNSGSTAEKTTEEVKQADTAESTAGGSEAEVVPVQGHIRINSAGEASRGSSFRYTKVLDMLATAYTYTGSPTASGVWPDEGVVAVDTAVIPLGTKLYVDGYGYARALDTGRDIVGSRIDLFMKSEDQALNWGVKRVKVYILEN